MVKFVYRMNCVNAVCLSLLVAFVPSGSVANLKQRLKALEAKAAESSQNLRYRSLNARSTMTRPVVRLRQFTLVTWVHSIRFM